jgi:hypothetical protein
MFIFLINKIKNNMKTNIFLSVVVVMGALLITGSCSKDFSAVAEAAVSDQTLASTAQIDAELKSANLLVPCLLTGTIPDAPVPVCVLSGTATESEAAGLLFMREEEKMARDVYAYLYAKYNTIVFGNITKSENAHMLAVLRLITAFKITDNSNNNPGEFTNTHIKDLYQQLITMGNISLIDALKVGVLIEQTDISDLDKELVAVQNASIKTVYTNIKAGSNAHLKAFIWNLKILGVVYP